MTEKKIILTDKAPAPIGPYSQAVQFGNALFVSGQIPMNPQTNEIIRSDIKSETMQVMGNIYAVLSAAGYGFEHVVKATIFITDMDQFSDINEVYGKYFQINPPVRETVQVARLPKDVNVEISVIAIK